MINHELGNKIFSFLNQCNSFNDRIDIDNMTPLQVKSLLSQITKLEDEIAKVKPILSNILKERTK